jgi:hypothetical protein
LGADHSFFAYLHVVLEDVRINIAIKTEATMIIQSRAQESVIGTTLEWLRVTAILTRVENTAGIYDKNLEMIQPLVHE